MSADHALSRNPATDAVIATYPFQNTIEIDQLLDRNRAAQRLWQATPMDARIATYTRLSAILRERVELLSGLMTDEMGKTLREARAEVEKCAATIDWIAQNGPAILADEPVDLGGADRAHVSFLPIGTILGVMPWNFPLWQVIRAAGPIMLSGNGFVLKHAPNVMGSAFAVQTAFEDAGFPKDLLVNLNAGNDAVARVIEDRRIAAVTLTGGTGAGSAVAGLAGRALKKSLLELGGSDPFIVLADADLDRAVEAGIKSRFGNAGQVCLAAKRFILERPIAEEFTAKFVEAARGVVAGNPRDPASTIGPLARPDLRAQLHDQVQRSVAQGARLLLGGHPIGDVGAFYAPTVLADVTPGMTAFEEETFGPVAALTVADDVEHAITLANTSEYGLSSALWTRDLPHANRIARRLETGGVFINGFSASNPRVPVGGIRKSGYGRELSHFGLREFTNAQTVWVQAEG